MTCFDSSNCASVVANRYKGRDPSCQHQHSQVSVLLIFLAGNSADDCFRMEDIDIWGGHLQTYEQLSWIFIVFLAGTCVVLNIVSFFYWQYKSSGETSEPQDSAIGEQTESSQDSTRDPPSTLELMGEDSMYRFFLSKSWWGWGIVLVTVAAQIGMGFIFVRASEYDFTTASSDLKYPWQCPPDLIDCRDTTGICNAFI